MNRQQKLRNLREVYLNGEQNREKLSAVGPSTKPLNGTMQMPARPEVAKGKTQNMMQQGKSTLQRRATQGEQKVKAIKSLTPEQMKDPSVGKRVNALQSKVVGQRRKIARIGQAPATAPAPGAPKAPKVAKPSKPINMAPETHAGEQALPGGLPNPKAANTAKFANAVKAKKGAPPTATPMLDKIGDMMKSPGAKTLGKAALGLGGMAAAAYGVHKFMNRGKQERQPARIASMNESKGVYMIRRLREGDNKAYHQQVATQEARARLQHFRNMNDAPPPTTRKAAKSGGGSKALVKHATANRPPIDAVHPPMKTAGKLADKVSKGSNYGKMALGAAAAGAVGYGAYRMLRKKKNSKTRESTSQAFNNLFG